MRPSTHTLLYIPNTPPPPPGCPGLHRRPVSNPSPSACVCVQVGPALHLPSGVRAAQPGAAHSGFGVGQHQPVPGLQRLRPVRARRLRAAVPVRRLPRQLPELQLRHQPHGRRRRPGRRRHGPRHHQPGPSLSALRPAAAHPARAHAVRRGGGRCGGVQGVFVSDFWTEDGETPCKVTLLVSAADFRKNRGGGALLHYTISVGCLLIGKWGGRTVGKLNSVQYVVASKGFQKMTLHFYSHHLYHFILVLMSSSFVQFFCVSACRQPPSEEVLHVRGTYLSSSLKDLGWI